MRRILLGAACVFALAPAALAQTKISNLPAASAVSATDVVPISQNCSGSPPTAGCAGTAGATAAQIKTFTSNAPTLVAPVLGTPASGDASNLTNIPVANAKSGSILPAANGGAGTINGVLAGNGSGVVSQGAASGLSNGVTGSGAVVLATSPTLVTPTLGVATVTTLGGKNAISSITLGASGQVGTGATAACATSHSCTSLSGEITLTTGTGTLAAGLAFTINFADTRTNIPNCVVSVFTKAGPVFGTSSIWVATTSTLAVNTNTALAASTAYEVDYVCGGN